MKKEFVLILLLPVLFIFSCKIKISKTHFDLNYGLVAYYPFNGNANDESGNGNNGVVMGAKLSSDRFGNPNSAYYFNGTDNQIIVPNSSSLQITGPITLSAWFNTTNNSSNIMGILSKVETSEIMHSYKIEIYNSKALVDLLYDHKAGIGSLVETVNTLTDGQWHHMLAEYDGSFVKLFIDGKLDAVTPYTAGMQINNENLYIGWDQNSYLGDRHFEGFIDDIRIYNRALSEQEMQLLYNLQK
jgi:hypothetical protein